jgi:hypothetical protein
MAANQMLVLHFVCRTSGASPGPVTCVDFDVFLPAKLHDKVAPTIDPLLEDKQVGTVKQLHSILGRAKEAATTRSHKASWL